MNIRFHIHDKVRYPDGALLEVDFSQLTERQAELLRATIDESGRCNNPLRVAGVNVANVWLTEPTIEALRTELERVEGIVNRYAEKRALRVRRLTGAAS